jgi:hypothetical protein
VADPRFEGGTSTAVASEIVAAARGGLNCALLMVKGPLLGHPFPVHPDLRSLVDSGAVVLVDPDTLIEVDLVLVHHPTIMATGLARSVTIKSSNVVLVLHHPRLNQIGKVQYDLGKIVQNCYAAFRAEVQLAPVSVVVRESLPAALPLHARLLADDWTNLIDLGAWLPRAQKELAYPVVIGRHSRPDRLKWPDEREQALLAYPDDASRYRVRILGADDFLVESYGTVPTNWELISFSWENIPEFLRSLDFYVFFHGSEWSEAFGRTIMEALAVGLVVILPKSFERIFGPAAVYAELDDVRGVIDRFVADPAVYSNQSNTACEYCARHFGLDQFVPRLRELFSISSGFVRHNAAHALPKKNVLFVSTNGIGLGHLTQQLAVARRLPENLTAVFATMSMAMGIVEREGYLAHFLTYHRHIDADRDRWNRVLAEELFDLIAFTRPRVIAFDGTYPFDGLLRAMAAFRASFSIWVRRPMWREHHGIALQYSSKFDAVIEPRELADAFDYGPTKKSQHLTYVVPPVLHLDVAERLERSAAMTALDVPRDATIVALQLGSGTNYDLRLIRRHILKSLHRHPDVFVLDIRSPIRDVLVDESAASPRYRAIELFPTFKYSCAFDFAISAAGYNSFHENVLGAVPTIFVPNEAEEMDLQLSRALFADVYGYGKVLRRDHDLYAVDEIIDDMMDPARRDEIKHRCRSIAWRNGATKIAEFVADAARFLRTDYDVFKY